MWLGTACHSLHYSGWGFDHDLLYDFGRLIEPQQPEVRVKLLREYLDRLGWPHHLYNLYLRGPNSSTASPHIQSVSQDIVKVQDWHRRLRFAAGIVHPELMARWIEAEANFCRDGILDTGGAYCCPKECGACPSDLCKTPLQVFPPCHAQSGPPPCMFDDYRLLQHQTMHRESDYQFCQKGILDKKGKACCPKECILCGGPWCDMMPAGAEKCCWAAMQDKCKTRSGPPPCAYHDFELYPTLTYPR
eukprot:gnl/TRDRNA2_/TRDRNA2_65650_c0_seq1.p1 gnl/TRDRNA2_/TRDRNA2_65650_c0~~gnl/TRDRNA2_/TRDRNA2_65650_c0_seq1.p1  ORF type:complete len:258 (-),score=8.94 gnl/TRDRNA2_/TRDRNA2_65650_c0_seq1:13-750(-)